MPDARTDRVRADVRVDGVVQGVGFRPFVYRTAVDNGLAGRVRNLGDAGVAIALEGPPAAVDDFLETLRSDPPPLARVETVDVDRGDPDGLSSFEIESSADAAGGAGTIPPDTGICSSCLADVRDPDSRYHGYWATACVDCGPRFTVIRGLPYDRPRTSMNEFPLCEACRASYEDPADRRYHAQAIACPDCGPTLSLRDPDGTELATRGGAVRETGRRLADGDLLAVKGVGGAHLACDATDADAVDRLRQRTGRPRKPFAVMAPSVDAVESFASLSPTERDAIRDVRRPILLVDRDGADWLDGVAPGLHTVGVMLPYSGLHHLLFDHVDAPLVMTSANLPGVPMNTTTAGILEDLGGVVDAALVHDREIVARCDDSVARVVAGDRRFVRRSRGWVPGVLPRPGAADAPDVLALGPEYDVTVAVARGDDVVPSQHVGDVDDPETLAFHREARDHLVDVTGADPAVVACDRHPGFETTAAAERLAADGLDGPVRVQHHHAHAASLLAERGRDRAVVVAADGTGYGPDGSVWGGEVLDATLADFERVGGLDDFRLPGGRAAVERPARTLASLLGDSERVDDLLVARDAAPDRDAAAAVRRQARRGVNAPRSSSAGRFLDAVSALLGACTERHYEGEPAMRLEALAADGSPLGYDVPFGDRDGDRVVDTAAVARDLAALAGEHPAADVAATAQRALADGLADVAVAEARDRGVDAVGFTGGVAYNDAVTRGLRERVRDADLAFLGHDRVPPGDAGVSYGQAVVATNR
ncbi:MAG: carbamoyltransferase HypF [Halobacterium sp.]